MVTLWLLLGALSLSILNNEADACSCMYSHPQEHYCSADFVAVVRVKSHGKGDGTTTAYHIKIKKEFKMSEKARHALSQGLVWTSAHDSTCGVTLKPTRYLITGRILGEKAWVSLCHFVQEWPKLSSKQKKGFRKLYQQGCHCKVRMTGYVRWFGHHHQHRGRYCPWETVWQGEHDCQGLHSFCVPSPHHPDQCMWVPSSPYRHCMKERQLEKEKEREREP
uniref:U48-Liphistoxin-Lth1a_1 n=1 Tax=Liphistius thaleban TaxID=1905330 RepID=A0A4Q8K6L6_9ARAC